ncbi:MAG: GxxExxY protein [Bacteroidales bacterium]|nr:GxxExxY protein [Bacteroidales bacterium]
MDVEQLIYEVRGAAMEVYNFFGPGLLESVYEKALVRELELRGLEVKTQLPVPIVYKDAVVGDELRIDILVENELIVELKSVEEFKPVYYKQLRTYLKLLNKDVGLLINFGEYDFKKGMRRIAI